MRPPVFDYAIEGVLWREGPYTNDPEDPGGPTSHGISLKFLKGLGLDIDHDGDIDGADIRALTVDDAKDLYYREFYLKGRLNHLNSDILVYKILDMCVNMGIKQAWKIVQQAANMYMGDWDDHVVEDGIPGPRTIAIVKRCADWMLLRLIRQEQSQFYSDLIQSKPVLNKYKLGWYRRAAV